MSHRPEGPAPAGGDRGPLLASAGAFAVILLFKGLVPPDTDTPWHLAQGRMLLRRWADGDLGLHAVDMFSWTARDVVALSWTGRSLDREPRPRALVVLMVLAVTVSVWAVLHGAVIAGVVAIVAGCGGEVVDRRTWRWPALTASVAVVASCLTPRGIGVWTYAIQTSGDSAREGIQEWQPPSLGRGQDVLIMTFLVIVVAFALRSRFSATSRFRWRLLAPGLVLTGLAFQAVRNQPLALLALLPFTARMLSAAGEWLGRREGLPYLQPGRVLGAMTVGALLGGAIQTGSLPVQPNPLRSPEFPAAAAAALPGGCRLLNEYNDGGYLILVRPDVPVSQDGRNDLYGPRRLQEQEDLLNEREPERAAASLRSLGVTCVLLRSDRPLARALGESPGREWRRIARDGPVEAWTRTR